MKNPASSDLRSASELFAELRAAGLLLTAAPRALASIPPAPTVGAVASSLAAAPSPVAAPPPAAAPPLAPAAPPAWRAAPPAIDPVPLPAAARGGGSRSERLRRLLAEMCKRGGFSGAVIADSAGLALADFNPPIDGDVLAAYSAVLGGAFEQAARLLGKRDANNLSLDINYVEKVVARRFVAGDQPCCLLVICPQSIDERSELELSIDQLLEVLQEA